MDLPVNKIICGDCLEVMKDWPDNCVNLVLTDPPYGQRIDKMNFVTSGAKRIGKARRNDYRTQGDWDFQRPSVEAFRLMQRISYKQAIFGGQYFADMLPASRCWYVWDKRTADKYNNNFADCELVWTSIDAPSRIIRHIWSGFLRGADNRTEPRFHPTQKPVKVMARLIKDLTNVGNIVVDCYCGVGATCVAAKLLGRRYIGIDISPEYCKIAEERLKAVETGVPVKEARAGQMALFER